MIEIEGKWIPLNNPNNSVKIAVILHYFHRFLKCFSLPTRSGSEKKKCFPLGLNILLQKAFGYESGW